MLHFCNIKEDCFISVVNQFEHRLISKKMDSINIDAVLYESSVSKTVQRTIPYYFSLLFGATLVVPEYYNNELE